MLYLIATLVFATVGLAVLAVGGVATARPAELTRRLHELERAPGQPGSAAEQAAQKRERIKELLRDLGREVRSKRRESGAVQTWLVQAGYRDPSAPAIYWGARAALAAVLGGLALLFSAAVGLPPLLTFVVTPWLAMAGWLLPRLYVGLRRVARQKEIRLALPDTLDLLVICMEAGLGLNQALTRVGREVRPMSKAMYDELMLLHFQMQAGSTREEALRGFAERTGVSDVRSLATMLIQSDRFGTSIAHGLRIQADTLREKRLQRAEEAAAKTTIKMVFPLALFIFPAMFVVILGPALIQIFSTLGAL